MDREGRLPGVIAMHGDGGGRLGWVGGWMGGGRLEGGSMGGWDRWQ